MVSGSEPHPTRNLVAAADAASFPSSSERPPADFSLALGEGLRSEGKRVALTLLEQSSRVSASSCVRQRALVLAFNHEKEREREADRGREIKRKKRVKHEK